MKRTSHERKSSDERPAILQSSCPHHRDARLNAPLPTQLRRCGDQMKNSAGRIMDPYEES